MVVEKVFEIIEEYNHDPGAIFEVLIDIQNEFSYLPEEGLEKVSRELEIPLSRLYSLATFYKAFSLTPKGRYPIQVCIGTACHVRGGQRILEKLEKELDLKTGETTEDLNLSLDAIRCLGSCCLAPVVKVGDEVYANLTQTRIPELLKKYKK
ncbi:NAD(P)H-dependent oxidoreductase subunit E [candidate division KSB1 bacterium]|nr:NAD(P)H-dependent oxidoreductase subunit E [candidate division KSB1 bacterium]